MSINKGEYFTNDLALAGALSLFHELRGLEKMDSKKVIFIFKDTPKLQISIKKYWQSELKVCPLAYFNQLKSLKSQIYQIQNSNAY